MAGYLGNIPSAVPLTSADIADSIITSAKIANGTIAIADFSATGTPSASTFLRGDNAWGSAGASAGQVIQVIGATDSTERSTTSNSFVTASNTLSVTITPSSASNKIFVLATFHLQTSSGSYATFLTIYRGATNLGNSTVGMGRNNDAAYVNSGCTSMSYLDSPSSTSALTYQVYLYTQAGGTASYLNKDNSVSSITAFEIKG